jgi:hypothetical protein
MNPLGSSETGSLLARIPMIELTMNGESQLLAKNRASKSLSNDLLINFWD